MSPKQTMKREQIWKISSKDKLARDANEQRRKTNWLKIVNRMPFFFRRSKNKIQQNENIETSAGEVIQS